MPAAGVSVAADGERRSSAAPATGRADAVAARPNNGWCGEHARAVMALMAQTRATSAGRALPSPQAAILAVAVAVAVVVAVIYVASYGGRRHWSERAQRLSAQPRAVAAALVQQRVNCRQRRRCGCGRGTEGCAAVTDCRRTAGAARSRGHWNCLR